jgi:hypothetical protein
LLLWRRETRIPQRFVAIQHHSQHLDVETWLESGEPIWYTPSLLWLKNQFNSHLPVLCCFVSGVYGTKGTGTTSTTPGARRAAAVWVGSNGDFWLFGGEGYSISPSSSGKCSFFFVFFRYLQV